MKKLLSMLFGLVLLVSLVLVTAAPVAAAGIIHVPDDYSTIQAALNASQDGDTIMVAAGTYDAFLVQGKSNLSIIGSEGTSVITANLVAVGVGPIGDAQVMAAVYDSTNINIEGIDFHGAGVSGEDVVGIAYVDSTGRIAGLTVEHVIGAAHGVGVAALGYAGSSTVNLSGTTIEGSMIGMFVDGGGSTLEAHFNNIVDNSQFGAYNYGDGALSATKNWWGDASGPYPYGTGDAISDNVDFTPWLGAASVTQTVTNGTVYATDADTEVAVTGKATVTVSRVLDNSGGPVHTGLVALDKYIDVYVPDATQVTEIVIRLYYTDAEAVSAYENYLRLLWWNGTEWAKCSETGVDTTSSNGYSGYMWAVVTEDTTPSLAQLQGTDYDMGYMYNPLPPTGCFIATAAYGTDTARQLDILREFRDDVLLNSGLGTKLVSLYYKTSPPVADFISQHEILRTIVRVGFVEPIVRALNWTQSFWSG